MKSLRYVVVSDLHLGAANSILTCLTEDNRKTRPNDASDLLVQFATCLREIAGLSNKGQRPTLILNGDILELALAGTNEATMTFRKFIEALCGREKDWPFDEKVYYLPGNHDHHLWNVAREKQYRENYLAKTEANVYLKPEFQTTNMFNDAGLNPIPCDYFTLALKTLTPASRISFLTVYPNFALLDHDKSRCVVFHHGHYIETIYSIMTRLKRLIFPLEKNPRRIWDLEAENGAWIDFFWSTLARSGEVGKDVELIYDKMQSKAAFDEILNHLAKSLAPLVPPKRRWASSLKAFLIDFALQHLVGSLAVREVHLVDSPLSKDAQTGLASYMQEYVLGEITRIQNLSVPRDMTFVFGHTHKPFESACSFKGFSNPVKLLNSGGWVVDTPRVSQRKGGAVIVVDEELNVASIRMYNEHGPQQPSRVWVNAAEKEDNAFFRELTGAIDPMAESWQGFSDLADRAVVAHRRNLKFHISAPD